jgi:hypothetical protein
MNDGVREARAQQPSFKTTHMNVMCVLAPPWFFSTVSTGSKEWDRPTTLDDRIYTSLEDEAKRRAFEVEGAAAWGTVVGDAEVLEMIPQRILLNGYPVKACMRQSVTRASVSVYLALVGTGVKKHVTEILERVLPNHVPVITTSTHMLAKLYRATMGSGSGNHGYLVEVGGHVTSIATLEHGVLSEVSTIPLGTNDILTATAPEAETAEEARGKLFVTLKSKELGQNELPENVHKALSEWRESIFTAFRKHSKGVIPHEFVFLMVGTRWLGLLVPFLSEPWMIPGIRETHSQVVTPVSVTVQPPKAQFTPENKQAWPALADSRLQVFTHSLFYSSQS